jgi:methyl-accepting chemotaxis protein
MHYKLPKSISTIFVIIILCNVSVSDLSHAGQDDIDTVKNTEDKHMKCLQQLANTTIDMLIATRGVIAKNQELINRDPTTGNYYVKGFVPAVVGSQVANDFSLMTGHKLKQTSLKIRNPSNAPDEWERKVLKFMETSEYSHGRGFGETIITNGNKIYRYMKPIYVEVACLQCHGNEEKVKPAIRLFLKRKYPFDEAFGYKEGDLRGGISINFSLEILNLEK